MKRLLARAAQGTLLVLLAATLAGSALSLYRLLHDPTLAPLVSASAAEIRAATDRALAEVATPALLERKLSDRLAEAPRNWLAIDGLLEVASDRGIALPPDLLARTGTLREADHSLWAETSGCLVCAWNVASCSLEQALICNAPITLTPVGDVAGVLRAGTAVATGGEVDEIDLGLSVVGLGATAAILASGGSSVTVKAGAGLMRLARGMGRLSPRLVAMATDTVRTGVVWARLPAARSADDLAAAIRTERFAGLANTAADLNRVREATDLTTALHLLPLVDDATDARRLADASAALGPKVVGKAEVLGKSRLLRATVHWSKAAWNFVASIGAMALAAALLLAHALQGLILRGLRRQVRHLAHG